MTEITRLGSPPATWVAVHGFTQRPEMFQELVGLVGQGALCPSLPGHDDQGGPADVATAVDRIVAALESIRAAIGGPAVLVGYSAGGRMAMEAALARPDLVRSLVVVAAGPGIAGERERAARRASDERLARQIESEGVERFIEGWVEFPMFSGLGRRDAAWRAADKAMRLQNTAAGLAAALRGFGQGTQPFLGDRIGRLAVPVTVIVGEQDRAYRAEGERLARLLPHGRLVVLDGIGHAVVGEAPEAVAEIVVRHLDQLE